MNKKFHKLVVFFTVFVWLCGAVPASSMLFAGLIHREAEECFQQGLRYYNGNGNIFVSDSDYREAVECFRKAAEYGHAEAQYYLGHMYSMGYGVKANDSEALKWYQKAAAQGNKSAQYSLGTTYYYGKAVKQDYAEAAKWYRKAAEQGDYSAQEQLGNMYKNGAGVKKNKSESEKWYKLANQTKAKEQEALNEILNAPKTTSVNSYASRQTSHTSEPADAQTQFNLGMEYYRKQNYEEAAKWWRKSAAQGNVNAQFNLGVILSDGKAVQRHDKEAAYWYGEAGKQGNAEAWCNLGVMYYYGKGAEQSHGTALGFFLKAAEMGHAVSQNNLGWMYQHGTGTPQDYEKAAYWYGKAAEQGFTEAQNNLKNLNQIRYEARQKTANDSNVFSDAAGSVSGKGSSYGGSQPKVITKRLSTGKVVRYTPRNNGSSSNSSPERCSACGGSGKCRECGGSGRDHRYGHRDEICWTCAGNGKCNFCDGKGYGY